MAEPTIQLGGGNWAGKSDNLLGYYQEDGRFYKQDFTFNRTTTGTYTDSDGYIQEMPYNLLTYSNDFSQWSLASGGSIDVNQTISPDGTQNATKLNTTSASSRVQQSISLSGINTMSIFVKYAGNDVTVRFERNTTNDRCSFDVSSQGVVFDSKESGIISYNIEQFSNDWYRISCSYDGGSYFQFNGDITGNAGSVYIYGAQINKGSSAKTYFPTTTRLNMPRVDYLNNSKGSLILEPQRSNLVTYSSDFSDSSWFKLGLGTASTAIVTTDYATSPEGLNNATRLQVDLNGGTTSSDQSLIYDAFAVSSGDNTRSIYVKSNDGNTYDVYFGGTLSSYEIKEVTSEWTRIDATRNFASAGTGYLSIGLRGGTGCSDNADILIYGAQVEAGSYPTTLINTSGSSVTRNADACTDGGDASRFNDSEGVLFFEGSTLVESGITRVISISDGSTSNNIYFNFNQNANSFNCEVLSGGSTQFNAFATMTKVNNNKIALKYKANDFALWINGTEVATDTSGITPTGLDRLNFDFGQGSFDFEGKCKQIQYYNTALTDTELATLTTL